MIQDPRLRGLVLWWFAVWLMGWMQQIFVALVYQYRSEEDIKKFERMTAFRTVGVKWYLRSIFLLFPKDGRLSIVWMSWQACAIGLGILQYLLVSPPGVNWRFWSATVMFMIVHVSIHIMVMYRVTAAITRSNLTD